MPVRPEVLEPGIAIATFDSAWTRIALTHFDTSYGGVDWPAVRDELRPQATAARTAPELREVLNDMVGRLRESHFVIIPRDAADALAETAEPSPRRGAPGFVTRVVEDRMVVTGVHRDGPAARAGIATGWVVLSVDGRDVGETMRLLGGSRSELSPGMARLHATLRVGQRLSGPEGSEVALTMLNGSDDTVRLSVAREAEPGELVSVLGLPPRVVHLEHERIPSPGGASVGVIRFNMWMIPIAAAFAAAVDAHRDADGIILDLRGNPGGLGAMVLGISGHFLDTTLSLGTLRTRTTELRFISNPQRVGPTGRGVRPYSGPLVILVDELSVSTSEIFAAGMQAVGRARVVGDTTTGQALPAHAYRLPSGDVLLHAFADFLDPRGERIEGRGVIPDETVGLRRDGLVRGRDAVLERALEVIEELRSNNGAGPTSQPSGEPS